MKQAFVENRPILMVKYVPIIVLIFKVEGAYFKDIWTYYSHKVKILEHIIAIKYHFMYFM